MIPETAISCRGFGCFNTTDSANGLCVDCWAFRPIVQSGLTRDYYTLSGRLARTTAPRLAHHVSGGSGLGPRSPVQDAVFDLMDELVGQTVQWADLVRRRLNLTHIPDAGARADWRFSLAMHTLAHLDFHLEGRAEAVDYYNCLYRLRRRLVRPIHGDISETERISGACHRCGSLTMVAREHRGYWMCLTCGARWGESAWHALTSDDSQRGFKGSTNDDRSS